MFNTEKGGFCFVSLQLKMLDSSFRTAFAMEALHFVSSVFVLIIRSECVAELKQEAERS